ncbi:MAG TPA: UDP-N-acetylmuramoyl-tripeptide--D-alanyl-D-alanine ligase [Prolixibacteraceae bacterium]|nr:UDP-N-acetylmuramoyl-tripeptide--D-alanyl-D-alanine ligase [Prolixibacteraceae bacterium]
MSIEELYQRFTESESVFTDSRLGRDGGMFFALKGEKFDGNDFVPSVLKQGVTCAVSDRPEYASLPGCYYVENTLLALQNLAKYHRQQWNIPVLAITGTNGKTTTKELITAVLQQKYRVLSTTGNLNNHIGVPLTLLSAPKEKHEIAVIEMGANHPGEIEQLCTIAQPDYGLITNVGKAHLEGFGSFEGVVRTKGELYESIARNGKGIFIHADNPILTGMAPANLPRYSYGSNNPNAELRGETDGNDMRMVCRILFPKGWLYLKTHLSGSYNLENVLAAARIGLHFGVDPMKIKKAIENYHPANSRSQIRKQGSNTLLVDCYNANPTSMEAALKHFIGTKHPKKVVILGDMLELGTLADEEHQKIVDLLKKAAIEEVYLTGQNFLKTDSPGEFQKAETTEELLSLLRRRTWENRLVLIKGSRGNQLERVIDVIK